MNNKVKFTRVSSLPETGVNGTLYFVCEGQNRGLWLYINDKFESYTPQNFLQSGDLTEEQLTSVDGDTLVLSDDVAQVTDGILKSSTVFSSTSDENIIKNIQIGDQVYALGGSNPIKRYPENIKIYPGHDISTTLIHEIENNIYFKEVQYEYNEII